MKPCKYCGFSSARLLDEDCPNNSAHEQEEIRRGELIAEVLKLRMKDGKYQTTWGSKTALGLFRTMERIVREGGII